MKITITLLSALMLLAACEKTIDEPSLHEKLNGRWKVDAYTLEQYHPSSNSTTRWTISTRPGDHMNFSGIHDLEVNFDTAAPVVWIYNIVDQRTLKIENREWNLNFTGASRLDLNLRGHDTSKIVETVIYHLSR